MLQHLSIENYALIRSLDADFAEGFCLEAHVAWCAAPAWSENLRPPFWHFLRQKRAAHHRLSIPLHCFQREVPMSGEHLRLHGLCLRRLQSEIDCFDEKSRRPKSLQSGANWHPSAPRDSLGPCCLNPN